MPVDVSTRPVVNVPTELTPAARAEFETRLRDTLQVAPAAVFLNCRPLQHVSSEHVSLFWSAYEGCAKAGVAVKLLEPSGGLIHTLQVTDLAHFFGLSGQTPTDTSMWNLQSLADTAGVYTDRFRPVAAAIDTAAERFTGFLKRLDSPEATCFDLRTVFYEVATNIRLHAQPDSAVDTTFTATVSDDKLVLCFRYTGVEFDPTRYAIDMDFVSAARRGQKRGFGLPMLHRMTDKVSYAREPEGWNVLTLEKRRNTEP